MTTMLVWRSLPAMHAASVKKFTDDPTAQPPGVKVLSWHHGVGIGFMLVESADMTPVYALCASWAHLVAIEAHPVLDTKSALTALKK